MSKQVAPVPHPNLWRWVAEYGTLEMGYCRMTNSYIRALDAGTLVWKGKAKYSSLEAALTGVLGISLAEVLRRATEVACRQR